MVKKPTAGKAGKYGRKPAGKPDGAGGKTRWREKAEENDEK